MASDSVAYDAYKAGVVRAALVDADESLRHACTNFVSLWAQDNRNVADHPLWDLLNEAQKDMAQMLAHASALARDAMNGQL